MVWVLLVPTLRSVGALKTMRDLGSLRTGIWPVWVSPPLEL